MSRKKIAPELKKRPHTTDEHGRPVVESLLAVLERLELLPWGLEYKRTIPEIWPWMDKQQERQARRWAREVEKKRKKWAAIMITVTPPTSRTTELLISVQATGTLLRIRPGEARIWRKGEIFHPAGGIERRVAWFDIRQPGLSWAREIATTWAAKLAPPLVELMPVPILSQVTGEPELT